MKKYNVNYKMLVFFFLIVLAILLVPMLYLSRYAVPQGDDFGFSVDTHTAVLNGSNLIEILKSAIFRVKETYINWQGSFSAIFMMALQPGIYGYRYYGITTIIMLTALLTGIFAFFIKLLNGLFGAKKSTAVVIASIPSIMCTQFLPNVYQAFYWYNGSVYYTFFFGIMLITFAIFISNLEKPSIVKMVLLTLLCFFIGGGNYCTAVLTILCGIAAMVVLIIHKDEKWVVVIPPEIAVITALIISMIAPGNSARIAGSGFMWIVETVLLCFKYCFINIAEWTNLPFLAMIAVLIPIAWNASTNEMIKFKYPGIVSAVLVCIYTSMYAPHLYALRTPGSSRMFDIYYYAFIITSIIIVFYWCGWIKEKKNKIGTDNIKIMPLLLSIVAVGLCCIIAITKCNIMVTSLAALGEIKSNEACDFFNENVERFKILEDPSITNAVLKPIKHTPYLLFSEDMKDDPNHFMNRDAANYFGKESIIVEQNRE